MGLSRRSHYVVQRRVTRFGIQRIDCTGWEHGMGWKHGLGTCGWGRDGGWIGRWDGMGWDGMGWARRWAGRWDGLE